jgi:hypothetical protein
MYFPPRADWNTNERERLTMSNSSDPERAPVLNENQRRHFEVLLSMLEESLQRIETLSSSLSMNGRMSIVKDDLPSTFILEAEPLIASIRARIGRLAAVLELTPRTVSKRRTISALLTAAIIRIEDSSPEQLRGYGTVDPRRGASTPRDQGGARPLGIAAWAGRDRSVAGVCRESVM